MPVWREKPVELHCKPDLYRAPVLEQRETAMSHSQLRWISSQHNFDPAIALPPRPVELHDLTLRDGEEAADLAFTTSDKVRLAEALARLGIKRTEIFLTVPGWQEVIRAIQARNLGLDLWVTWQPGKIEQALDLGARHVMIWYRIGEAFQKHVLKRS